MGIQERRVLPCQIDESSHRLSILKIILENDQVLLLVTDRSHTSDLLQALDMAGQGQDIEVVIQEDAGVVGGQAQDESFIEPVDYILMGLCAEPRKQISAFLSF